MRESLGVSSNQSVLDLLSHLEKKKMVKRNASSARSLTILPLGYKTLGAKPLIAFGGTTAAGAVLPWLETPNNWQTLSPEISQFSERVFLLKINGDSMINAGIDDGDMVLVQEAKEFVSGNVVLAQIGDSSTVKRFISQDKPPYVFLKPENPNYKIILVTDDTRLVGKVISVLKKDTWQAVR